MIFIKAKQCHYNVKHKETWAFFTYLNFLILMILELQEVRAVSMCTDLKTASSVTTNSYITRTVAPHLALFIRRFVVH